MICDKINVKSDIYIFVHFINYDVLFIPRLVCNDFYPFVFWR